MDGVVLGLGVSFSAEGFALTDGWEVGNVVGCTLILGCTLGVAVGEEEGDALGLVDGELLPDPPRQKPQLARQACPISDDTEEL